MPCHRDVAMLQRARGPQWYSWSCSLIALLCAGMLEGSHAVVLREKSGWRCLELRRDHWKYDDMYASSWHCHGGSNQQFHFTPVCNDSEHSGFLLRSRHYDCCMTKKDDRLECGPCSTGGEVPKGAQWLLSHHGQLEQEDGLCLESDTSRTDIRVSGCTSANNQQFFVAVDIDAYERDRAQDNGTQSWLFLREQSEGRCLEVRYVNFVYSTFSCIGSSSQQFQFRPGRSDPSLGTIRCHQSHDLCLTSDIGGYIRCLDCAAGPSSGSSQEWSLTGYGQVTQGGLCLGRDLDYDSIHLTRCTGGSNQRFAVLATDVDAYVGRRNYSDHCTTNVSSGAAEASSDGGGMCNTTDMHMMEGHDLLKYFVDESCVEKLAGHVAYACPLDTLIEFWHLFTKDLCVCSVAELAIAILLYTTLNFAGGIPNKRKAREMDEQTGGHSMYYRALALQAVCIITSIGQATMAMCSLLLAAVAFSRMMSTYGPCMVPVWADVAGVPLLNVIVLPTAALQPVFVIRMFTFIISLKTVEVAADGIAVISKPCDLLASWSQFIWAAATVVSAVFALLTSSAIVAITVFLPMYVLAALVVAGSLKLFEFVASLGVKALSWVALPSKLSEEEAAGVLEGGDSKQMQALQVDDQSLLSFLTDGKHSRMVLLIFFFPLRIALGLIVTSVVALRGNGKAAREADLEHELLTSSPTITIFAMSQLASGFVIVPAVTVVFALAAGHPWLIVGDVYKFTWDMHLHLPDMMGLWTLLEGVDMEEFKEILMSIFRFDFADFSCRELLGASQIATGLQTALSVSRSVVLAGTAALNMAKGGTPMTTVAELNRKKFWKMQLKRTAEDESLAKYTHDEGKEDLAGDVGTKVPQETSDVHADIEERDKVTPASVERSFDASDFQERGHGVAEISSMAAAKPTGSPAVVAAAGGAMPASRPVAIQI
eukprot:TRINITY_DN74330_c0_g1_i1.p1 TRINITY_DN74330_c0_g1~~TRINITY_DN74330_c0_g1_i1.p1  ORF type:complete len:936 (-),score=142.19 TRINITY_DN74330_c0_g1_i1:504-3311(-)